MKPDEIASHTTFLRRLAHDVARCDADAEDLVQESWLTALRRPPRGPGTLRSWLRRVLRRRARETRRSEERRSRRERAAATPEFVTGVDTRQREAVLESLVRNLRALPADGRTVLFLRYFDQLTFSEMAERLNVPLETVRTRHRRAVARLRKSLDADAGGRGRWVAALFPSGASAVSGESVATTASIVGWVAMSTNTKIALGVATIVVASSAWWWTTDQPGNEPAPSPSWEAPETRGLEAAVEPNSESTAEIESSRFEGHEQGEAEKDQVAENQGTIRGRCLDSLDLTPLAGCIVRLSALPVRNRDSAEEMKRKWPGPIEVTTDPTGEWEFNIKPLPGYEFSVGASCPGRVRTRSEWFDIGPSETKDFGDVLIASGSLVSGIVLDEQSRPVPSFGVSVQVPALPFGSGRGARQAVQDSTDEHGRFHLRRPVPAGAWPIESHPGFRIVRPSHIQISESAKRLEVDIVVARLAAPKTISGVVLTEIGTPVEGATVAAIDPSRMDQVAHGETDAHGRFMLKPRVSAASTATVVVRQSPGVETAARDSVPWGTTDLRLTVREPGTLELTVVEAGTERPVTEYAVRCFVVPRGVGRWPTSMKRLRLQGLHEDGRLRVRDVNRGLSRLQILPTDTSLSASPLMEFEMPASGFLAKRVLVYRNSPFKVLVVDTDGRPVYGSEVELIADEGTVPFQVDSHAVEGESEISGPKDRGRLLTAGSTDAAGSVRLEGPHRDPRCVLRVKGAATPKLVRPVVVPENGEPLRVVVAAACVLRGRLEPVELVESLKPTIALLRRNGSNTQERISPHTPSMSRDSLRVKPDGTFEIKGLPAGRWEVHLGITVVVPNGRASFSNWTRDRGGALEEVDLVPGKVTEVVLRAPHLRLSSVRGRLLVNGQRRSLERVNVARCYKDDRGRLRRSQGYAIQVELDGTFDLGKVPAGYYILGCRFATPDAPGRQRLWAHAPAFEVRGGTEIDRTFNALARELRVRALEADGTTPVANRTFRIYSIGPGRNVLEVTSDSEGWMTLPTLLHPPLRFSTLKESVTWDAYNAMSRDERRSVFISVEDVEFSLDNPPASISIQLPPTGK